MNTKEKLHQYAYDNNINVHNFYLGEDNLKGLYMEGNIAVNTSIQTSAEESCVIAEELGHHFTSVGNILNTDKLANNKQERQARLWGYNKIIGLQGIINCFEAGCQSATDAAEYLGVTEEYFQCCIKCYTEKYGVGTCVDNYYIMFIPHLGVMKMV